jgi:hypothetical protein
MNTIPRERTCSQCPKVFQPARPMQDVCGLGCAKRKVRAVRVAKEKAEREHFKARKEAVKTIGDLIDEAQRECNAYIRLRDAGKPCFDCGKPMEPNKVGGSMDAGHVRSRGAAGHLRFDENNIFGQRKNCNRPGGATEEARKAGAAARVGWDVVNALYADNRVHKWTREELTAIKAKYRAMYRAKLKALQHGETT